MGKSGKGMINGVRICTRLVVEEGEKIVFSKFMTSCSFAQLMLFDLEVNKSALQSEQINSVR